MDDFIKSVTKQLGIDPGAASNAVGSLLGMLKSQGDKGAVGDLLKKLPGADALIGAAGSGGTGGAAAKGGVGGLMGKVGGMVGGLTGGGASGAGGLAGLAVAGLSGDKVKSFVKMFVEWARKKVGAEIVDKAINSVPALKGLIG